MNIAVLGASGRTGASLVERALATGYQVTAVVRRPAAFALQHPRLCTVGADLMNASSLADALRGADAVCSTLGSNAPRDATTLYSASMRALLEAMQRIGLRRVVALTAIPAQPKTLSTLAERLVVHRLLNIFFGGSYQDMVRMEQVLSTSDTDWTVLRPPRLLDGPPKGHYRMAVDARLPGALNIRRADLAQAMLDAVEDRTLFGHAVTVAS